MGYSPFFLVYGFEAILSSDIAFGALCIQNCEEGEAEATWWQEIDSAEEHRINAALQHARYEQRLRHYHDRNIHGRDFNMGDTVL
jgi:hypothetical protein